MTPTLYTSASIAIPLAGAALDLSMLDGHGGIKADGDRHYLSLECGTTTLHIYGGEEQCARLLSAIEPLFSDEVPLDVIDGPILPPVPAVSCEFRRHSDRGMTPPAITAETAWTRWDSYATALMSVDGMTIAEIRTRFAEAYPAESKMLNRAPALAAE